MGLVKHARKAAGRAKPLLNAAREVEEGAANSDRLTVLASTPAVTASLESLLGVRAGRVPSSDGLLVYGAIPGHLSGASLAALARHKESGGRVLVLLSGSPLQCAQSERDVLAVSPLELSDLVRVGGYQGAAGHGARDAVILALGDDVVAVGRANDVLRQPIARSLIQRASNRSAAVGAAGFLPGAELPVLLAQQVRLVSQLSALHGRPGGRARTVEIAGVVAAGYGWRALARRAVSLVPGAKVVVRSGFAYGATRSAGEAALKTFSGSQTGVASSKRIID